MIKAYLVKDSTVVCKELSGKFSIPDTTVWVDVVSASVIDVMRIEQLLGVETPTPDEMLDIEVSSRLYHEAGDVYMIANAVGKSGSEKPKTVGITYIVTNSCLITVRSTELHSFEAFAKKCLRQPNLLANPDVTFINLVESTTDRLGELLKQANEEIQELSPFVFGQRKSRGLGDEIRKLGTAGNLVSLVHDSLTTFNRVLTFYRDTVQTPTSNALNSRVDIILRDVHGLNEHAAFLSHRISFYLDAALGIINAEQNQTIKIFSVAAVIFLPPTLVASIYGMNFQFLPELSWPLGYPFALSLMVLSAVLPFWYFKRKGWI